MLGTKPNMDWLKAHGEKKEGIWFCPITKKAIDTSVTNRPFYNRKGEYLEVDVPVIQYWCTGNCPHASTPLSDGQGLYGDVLVKIDD